MATKLGEPIFPLNNVIRHYMQQTLQSLEVNSMTQGIYPYEVYPGYKEINAARKTAGRWFSTGEGVKSFRGRMVHCDENGDITLVFSFLDHMRFAELGVGAGVNADEVERNRNAKYKNRYVRIWDRSQGRSHRPAVMMELRHLQTRIKDYMENYYGMQFQMEMVHTFEGLTIDFGE